MVDSVITNKATPASSSYVSEQNPYLTTSFPLFFSSLYIIHNLLLPSSWSCHSQQLKRKSETQREKERARSSSIDLYSFLSLFPDSFISPILRQIPNHNRIPSLHFTLTIRLRS
ncbi:hypothetical protein RJT34_06907 [Clitoria ternatea]|uniref:Uncharacterized protein n=1 Tax=Clitoria ternatea TaxID=43366 RepID=A0AAN9K4K2_CLITE